MIQSKIIDPDFFNDLLSEILFLCPPKKKSKYSPRHYLKILIFILKTGCSYRDCLEFLDVPVGHYTTVYKKFKSWSDTGVFDVIYEKLLRVYAKKQFKHLSSLDVYIDSTHIRNKGGLDLISYGYKDHGKKGNTITVVVDYNRFPLYFRLDSADHHDGILVEPVIRDLDISEIFPPELNIIGDGGYIKKIKKRIGKRTINIISPRRNNEKRTGGGNTRDELRKFKKRHVVENVFASLKQYRRISNRYDKTSSNYFSYLLFGMIILEMKALKGTKINFKEQKQS